MDTESLKILINDWIVNQSDFSEKTSLRILASKEDIKIHVQSNPRIIECLRKESVVEQFTHHSLAVTRNILIRKLRDAKIEWNNSTLSDFLKLFPNKDRFNQTKGIGKSSITIMSLILIDNNLEWPDR